jgi:uncharacterized membrane protein YfcA
MSMSVLVAFVPLLILGAGLGLFGGLFGIGGGIIAIPVLVMGFGMDQATAQGTALVMMVPNLLLAWWRYARRNPVSFSTAGAIALVATLTTWATAQLAQRLDQHLLRGLFALFLLFLAVRSIRGPRAVVEPSPRKADLRFLPLVGLAGGSSMGLLGIGGGLVATPLFAGWFGLGQRVSQSLALALVAPSSVIALIAYAQNGHVDWRVGVALGAGGMLTVSAGVALAHIWPERLLQRSFGWMLAATALWLVVGPLVLGR